MATPGLLALGPLIPSTFGATSHTVRRGDTLSEIAVRYGTTVNDIKRSNGLKSDLIKVGQKLNIPQTEAELDTFKKEFSKYRINRSKWKYIVTHHSAIKNGNAKIYDKNHRRRGMQNGLAYHFVIGNGIDSGDGQIEIGSRWKNQLDGGHVRSSHVNQHGVGICLIGNFQETRPTTKQIASFSALVDLIGNYHLGGNFKYTAHKEVDKNHTVCPGRYFPLKSMHERFG